MRKPDAVRLYRSGEEPTVEKLMALDDEVTALKEKVARLKRDSSSSSKPPSGRKPGGQPGHKGYSRVMLPPGRPDPGAIARRSVRRAPVAERGWSSVQLTRAELLATTHACRNQAFRFAMAWGVQFHPEIDAGMIESWSIGTEDFVELRRVEPVRLPSWRRRAPILFGNFLRMAECVGRST